MYRLARVGERPPARRGLKAAQDPEVVATLIGGELVLMRINKKAP